ncbi:hypothetical protein HD554DRAFT_1535853 [Boletus coccyginus]|nr:hypothetical protein HD554DRAFT_1535853 [Boletus coccyginus]
MFRTRFSFPFSRIFRLRRRCATKATTSSSEIVSRAPCSGPSHPSKPRRPISQLEPIDTTRTPSSTRRPRSLFIPSNLTPIAQSPPAISPDVTPIPGTPTPILIIGRDPPRSILSLPPAPAPPGDGVPRAPGNGVLLIEPQPAPKPRRVSFQLPTTHAEDRPESPFSTCSTLVAEEEEAGVGAGVEVEVGPVVPSRPEQSHVSEALRSDASEAESFDSVAELPSVVRSGSRKRKVRPISLFTAQPVRADVSRFSLPINPTVPTMAARTNVRDSRRESKRTSYMPSASGSDSTKKARRATTWSGELNKPETQEVLRAIRGF